MEILMDLMNKHKKSGYKKRENPSYLPKGFEISCKPNENSGDIAPGMSILAAISFRPNDLLDNEDKLIVIVGDGVIKVPINARREKCNGHR